jgi:Na+/H+ antiporter NhaD/arsenite permease-like protein
MNALSYVSTFLSAHQIVISGAIFSACYLLIAFEQIVKLSKSALALFCGGTLWIYAASFTTLNIKEALPEAASGIFAIIIFLFCAMSLVEILVHYRFFDIVRQKLYRLHLSDRGQFLLITVLAFFLSAILDNMTTTIIMIQISRKFFKGENLLVTGAAIVVAANAGGAFSPFGDVTTIMLWFAEKYTWDQILLQGFLPSFALFLVTVGLMFPRIKQESLKIEQEIIHSLTKGELTVVIACFLSFPLPLVMTMLGIEPYMGLVIGLSVVWMLTDIFKRNSTVFTHSFEMKELLHKVDNEAIYFFIGILLAVGALHYLGTLHALAGDVYGSNPGISAFIIGNTILGLMSAVLDNVPLTDMAIKMNALSSSDFWILLALTVGTGGSLFSIGSAAGVVASNMLDKEGLKFWKYIKITFIPGIIGYAVGIFVWYVQFSLLH